MYGVWYRGHLLRMVVMILIGDLCNISTQVHEAVPHHHIVLGDLGTRNCQVVNLST